MSRTTTVHTRVAIRRTFILPVALIAATSALSLTGAAQNIARGGRAENAAREHPCLSSDEMVAPLVMRKMSGTVGTLDGKILEGAYIEIKLANGNTLGTYTDKNGRFDLRSIRLVGPFAASAAVPPSKYRFKVSKEGFQSSTGCIMISRNAPKDARVSITLKPLEGFQAQSAKMPDDTLLPFSSGTLHLNDPKHQSYPEKYAAVFMPISLAAVSVRTPEFPVEAKYYDIMLQVGKPLAFIRMKCMMGVTSGSLDEKDCMGDPLVSASWTVWEDGRMVHWGSIPTGCACIFTKENIYKRIGSFQGQAGKKFVVQIRFLRDGTPLDVASPKLIVIPHKRMW